MSRLLRGAALSALLTTTLALGAAVSATPATAAGTLEVVDPAGDARNAFGVNVAEVDLRSVDVATTGSDLTYTFQVDDFPALQNRIYTYALSVRLPDGRFLTAAASNANPPESRLAFRSAGLTIGGLGEDDFEYAVVGTSSVDRGTDTVTLRFPLEAVRTESAVRGIPVLGAPVTQVEASSSASTYFRVVATDSAFGMPFVIG